MKSDLEIVLRIRSVKPRDLFGAQTGELVARLPFEAAREFLKAGASSNDWPSPEPRDHDGVVAAMRDYIEFALEKALGHRGLSAARSLDHFRAWLWLLEDDETLAFVDDSANYPNYGMPCLFRIAQKYDFELPKDKGADRMARGEDCSDHCHQGCGQ